MVRNNASRAVVFAASLIVGVSTAFAQDPAKIDPKIYNCTVENDRIRLCEVTFEPGATIAAHAHPDRVTYVISGGTLKITGPDGKTNDVVFTPGKAQWFLASSHSAKNEGKTEVKLIMVELKK